MSEHENQDHIETDRSAEHPKQAPEENITDNTLIIVGIGASAGGLEALQELVKNLKQTPNVAYLIAQHLSPTYKSMMVDLLSKESVLPVKEAKHNYPIKQGHIYVCPPNNNITVKDDRIILSKPKATRYGPKPSIDLLLESIAVMKKAKSVGIILSGTGTDGARGIRIIKSEAGFTFVQDPNSAKYDGMPNAAIHTAKVDFILTPEEIGRELRDILIYPNRRIATTPDEKDQAVYRLIFNKLNETMKIDFSQYKSNTLHRRIDRRMASLKIHALSDYNNYLQKHYGEAELLYKNILIGVTSFYRDFKAFDFIKDKLIERIKTKNQKQVRIWVPGCSTGEEAYTFAIMLSEILGSDIPNWKIQIFATDIDDDALEIARKGSYPDSALMPLSKTQREKYFNIVNEQFMVTKVVREMVIFSRHNLIADPPFLKLDLITCRNLLIYFNQNLQKKLIPSFHYALNANGLLMLGKSENIGQFHNYFKTLEPRWRIFEANFLGDNRKVEIQSSLDMSRLYRYSAASKSNTANPTVTLQDIFISKVQEIIMPMCILINEVQDIIYSGGKNPYISRPMGASTDNLLKNIHPGLTTELRMALQKANKEQRVVHSTYQKIEVFQDVVRYVRLTVVPMDIGLVDKPSTLVCFQEINPEDTVFLSSISTDGEDSKDKIVRQLENELMRSQNQLQTLIEEMETSNEELQSMNEELQSANEELQSTNEELETTNEELQSTNEELQTAYSELRVAYSDMESNTKILQKTERRLTHLNQQFTHAQEVARLGHFDWNIEKNVIEWSNQMFKIFDFHKDVVKPTVDNILARVYPEDRQAVRDEIDQSFKSGKFQLKYRLIMDDRSIKYIEGQGKVHKNKEGQPVRMIGTTQDISEKSLIEQEAMQLSQQVTTLMDCTLVGVYIYNLQSRKNTYINTMYSNLTGYSKSDMGEMPPEKFIDLFHPDDVANVQQHMKDVIQAARGSVLPCQYRFRHKKGEWIQLYSTDTIFRYDNQGNPTEFLGVFVEYKNSNQNHNLNE